MAPTLFWISVVVAAELVAFDLLQKSVDSAAHRNAYIAIAVLLMGIGVSLAFREALRNGDKLAIANLYWIAASSMGSIALGYFAFGQKLRPQEILAAVLVILAAVVLLT